MFTSYVRHFHRFVFCCCNKPFFLFFPKNELYHISFLFNPLMILLGYHILTHIKTKRERELFGNYNGSTRFDQAQIFVRRYFHSASLTKSITGLFSVAAFESICHLLHIWSACSFRTSFGDLHPNTSLMT